MYFIKLDDLLKSKSDELSQQMQEIIDKMVPIYNTGIDVAMNYALLDKYNDISSYVDTFMKLVLTLNMLEQGSDIAYATLVMPNGEQEYCIAMNETGVVDDAKLIHTPIGTFEYYVYRCICDIPNNPVQLFYRWIKMECDLAHVLIQLSPDGYVPKDIRDRLDKGEDIINWDASEAKGFEDDVLNYAILDEAGINDPLNLCSLDTCLVHIEEFFNSYGLHSERRGSYEPENA